MDRSKPSGYILWAFIAIAMLTAVLLTFVSLYSDSNNFRTTGIRYTSALVSQPVNVSGTILSADGQPLAGASVTLQGRTVTTGPDGSFVIQNAERANSLLSIGAPGYRTGFIPLHLFVPAAKGTVSPDPILMESTTGELQLLFGGDTHFGRRYIDPAGTTPRNQMPPDNPGALIRVSDPEPGTRKVLAQFRPWFQAADFTSLNLESAVVRNISTPHWEKQYILFTLPGSLPALTWLGVRYVTLGNNHVNDYLEQGMGDTLDTLDRNGIAHSGAGMNATEAFEAYHTVLNGTPYAFLSMNSIDGSEHRISYVATGSKSGSANLRDTLQVNESIRREADAGYLPVVQLHGGDEYTYEPAAYIRQRMDIVSQAGAGLVVAHHPHIAQGVEIMNGVVVIEGLGNFAFDTERLESELGLLAQVDMDGRNITSVRLVPVYLENFTPTPITGRLADTFLRRVGEFSHNASAPVYPYNGQGIVTLEPNDTVSRDRTLAINVTVPESGTAVVDLRPLEESGESLAVLQDAGGRGTVQAGRDIMLFGDFEDWDVDKETGETSHWDTSAGSSFLCMSDAYQGTAALCSVRYGDNNDDAVVAFRNRIRVMGDALNQTPNKNLSLVGYIRGQEAGPVTIVSRYWASEGDITFGEEEVFTNPGGTFPWQQFTAEIHMPADDPLRMRDPITDPRALQIFIHQSPPDYGRGIAEFDELAVVNWEDTYDLSGEVQLKTPNARDFLRISGSPGVHQLNLTFRSYRPAAVG